MAREVMVYSFGTTNLAVPPGATAALLVKPFDSQVSMSLKYVSGGSLELFNASQNATTAGAAFTGTLATGYLFATTEVLNVTGAPKYYLAATGATAVAALVVGLSAKE